MLSHRSNISSRLVACFAAVALLQAVPVYGKPFKCRSENVTVYASDTRDAVDSCRGAANAMKFLASQGLSMPATITIRLANGMPDTVRKSALGAYVRETREVHVLTYSALQLRGHSFKAPLNRSLYRAVVSHEVAHAIAAANFKKEPSCLGQEYIAYVTLFSTMESTQRERILRQFPYEENWQVQAPVMYVFNSLEYGAHAYRHFLKAENGKGFINKVLRGEVLSEFE
jgi:hypothetical protein